MADVPRWAAPATLAISAGGLGTSTYLTWTHYAEPTALSCPDTGAINCVKVTTSAQSMVFGNIPVAVLGVAYFIAMIALCLPAAWRAESPWLSRARIAAAVVGIAWVLYLVGVELLAVHAICLWCTGVHVLAFALFVAVIAASQSAATAPPQVRDLDDPGGAFDGALHGASPWVSSVVARWAASHGRHHPDVGARRATGARVLPRSHEDAPPRRAQTRRGGNR